MTMGMVKCKECQQAISSNARTCPHCGAPIPFPLVVWLVVLPFALGCLVLILFLLGRCIVLAAR
jgi:hypothetical protein